MLTQELQAIVTSLSMEERRLLLEVLDEDAQKKPEALGKDAMAQETDETSAPVTFPLRGTSGVMHEPFEPAVEPDEWDALKQSGDGFDS